jgi:hypothetical protein
MKSVGCELKERLLTSERMPLHYFSRHCEVSTSVRSEKTVVSKTCRVSDNCQTLSTSENFVCMFFNVSLLLVSSSAASEE